MERISRMNNKITFGIYPLSPAGTPFGLAEGPEDDFDSIMASLNELRANGQKVIPRMYFVYTPEWAEKLLKNAEKFARLGLLENIVIGVGDWTKNDDTMVNLKYWQEFIEQVIVRYGSQLYSLQITNEPNLSFMEGSKPYVYDVLITGVLTARRVLDDLNFLTVKVGFGSVPESNVSVKNFWPNLMSKAPLDFMSKVDFVGHNFYVDVFEEVELTDEEIIENTQRHLVKLRQILDKNNLSQAEIFVSENGWPTGINPMTKRIRNDERQAQVLTMVVDTIVDLSNRLNISHYSLFGLRDADTQQNDLFYHYGILKSDYSKKPGFDAFKTLVQKYGR